nr:MAG TPA: hypothetical protein [Caudoviricetes sp.]
MYILCCIFCLFIISLPSFNNCYLYKLAYAKFNSFVLSLPFPRCILSMSLFVFSTSCAGLAA